MQPTPSLAHMRQWMSERDPNATYVWWDCSCCLFRQYADDTVSGGYSLSVIGSVINKMRETDPEFTPYDYAMIGAGNDKLYDNTQACVDEIGHLWTFGQAIARLDVVINRIADQRITHADDHPV